VPCLEWLHRTGRRRFWIFWQTWSPPKPSRDVALVHTHSRFCDCGTNMRIQIAKWMKIGKVTCIHVCEGHRNAVYTYKHWIYVTVVYKTKWLKLSTSSDPSRYPPRRG
jgi:hypothetical protein